MSTITTINGSDQPKDSRAVINQNFVNLNTDKAETSALTSGLATKQDTLVSGTNIKTVNGNSLLGSGDIVISGGGGVTDHGALTGLADDDHTQYTKADGTRAFTGKVSYATHPTFSADTEIVDKKYVDDSITAGGGYTNEQAQDAVGTILVDSARIDFTYNDATPSITADIIDDSVTFPKIQNINTNRILGRSTAGSGDIEELNISSIPALIGLGTSDSPQFAGVNVGHASDTTITRVSSGVVAVEGVTIPTISSTSTLTNKTLTKPVIQGSVQNVVTIAATVGGTTTLDLATSNCFIVTLGGNTTIAISNATVGQHFWIKYVQDATGSRTVTQFTTIKWAGGTAPTLTTTANKYDWMGHTCTSAGNYDGVIIGQNI